MTREVAPHEPRVFTADLPGCGGRTGPEPEHFVVRELPLYEPAGGGQHVYVRLQKVNLTTPELVRVVSEQAGVRERDIGYAGLKDKHAITEQWLSLPDGCRDVRTWRLPQAARVLEVARHKNKLRTGHLRGNTFAVTLVDVPPGGYERATAIIERLQSKGLPNYFGAQRFGRGGKNLGEASAWFERPMHGKGSSRRRFREKLYASVLQSQAFNGYLSQRIELGLGHLLLGEVVRLAGTGSHFVVDDPAAEQARLSSGDLILTGPMFGPRALAARGDAGALEQRCVDELGLSEAAHTALARHAAGTRRDLLVAVEDTRTELLDAGRLLVEFSLPKGSFGTQLVRELTREPWL